MAKFSYKLLHLFFKKLKSEDKESDDAIFITDNKIDPKVAVDKVFNEASTYLMETYGNKEEIYKAKFTEKGEKKVWNELFVRINPENKDKHIIREVDFKKYLATNESWVTTLYGHLFNYKEYIHGTRYHIGYTIAFYFRCSNLNELENIIKREEWQKLKDLFLEEVYKELFDDLPEKGFSNESKDKDEKTNLTAIPDLDIQSQTQLMEIERLKELNIARTSQILRKRKFLKLYSGFMYLLVIIAFLVVFFSEHFVEYDILARSKNVISVMNFEGDSNESYKIGIISDLNSKFGNNDIAIRKTNQSIGFEFSANEGHEIAKEKGGKKKSNSLVIWGNIANEGKDIYPRISIVDDKLNYTMMGVDISFERLDFQNKTLPKQVIDSLVVLMDYIMAIKEFNRQNYEKSIEYLNGILQRLPLHNQKIIDVYFLLGNNFTMKFESDTALWDFYISAEKYFYKILDCDSTIAEAHYNLGYLMNIVGNNIGSIQFYSNSVRYNSNYIDVWRSIGVSHDILRNSELASKCSHIHDSLLKDFDKQKRNFQDLKWYKDGSLPFFTLKRKIFRLDE